ncbi:MAG: peptidylprolyl isomerase [Planctomycetia bacterium]|nr:peptidylprolyl isomerase [Planctomycetia bacterium]
MLITTKGNIEIELFEDDAPNTVANFIFLVEKGFYTNLDFHRVIQGFMAQGGGSELLKTETNLDGTLKRRGNGGPGYSIPDEINENSRKHFRGMVSMANAGPDTGGSQFFIMLRPRADLDGKHTVFGRVVSGMENVSFLLRRTQEEPDPNQPEKRREEPGIEMPDKILSAYVVRKRNHEYSPRLKPDKNQRPPFPKMPGQEDKPSDILGDNWDVFDEIQRGMP